jgi:hypothetical protein
MGPPGQDPGGGGNGNRRHGRPSGGGGGPPDDGDDDPTPNPAAGGQAAGQPDMKPIGELSLVFMGDRELVEQFLDKLEGYFLLNQAMPRYNGGGNKTALVLTLIRGADMSGWAKDMQRWLASLDPWHFELPEVYKTFVAEFMEQFTDMQATIRVQTKLDNLHMKHPQIDKYIVEFEKTARKAGYTQVNPEMAHFFLKGLARKIIEDVLRAPRLEMYQQLKTHAIESTRSKLLLQDILKGGNAPYRLPFLQRFAFQNAPQRGMPPRAPRYYNSSNVPRSMANVPVPMDIGRT